MGRVIWFGKNRITFHYDVRSTNSVQRINGDMHVLREAGEQVEKGRRRAQEADKRAELG